MSEDKKTVLVTGSQSFVKRQSECIKGCGVHEFPHMRIVPLGLPDSFLEFDCILFTSVNGVDIFFDLMKKSGRKAEEIMHCRTGCIGPGTAEQLIKYGIHPEYIPDEYTAVSLGRMTASEGDIKNILILRAREGSAGLAEELERAHKCCTDHPLYYAEPAGRRKLPDKIDRVIFGSAGGVRMFFSLYPDFFDRYPECIPVCIGRITADCLHETAGVNSYYPKRSTVRDVSDIVCRIETLH